MGFASGYTAALRIKDKSVEDSRCWAIGNTFHIPSICLCLFMPFAGPAHSASTQHGADPRHWYNAHVPHSIWNPAHPRLTDKQAKAGDVMADVCSVFPAGFFPGQQLAVATSRLQHVAWGVFAHWALFVESFGDDERAKRPRRVVAGLQDGGMGGHSPTKGRQRRQAYTNNAYST